jgi:hypothetical protein
MVSHYDSVTLVICSVVNGIGVAQVQRSTIPVSFTVDEVSQSGSTIDDDLPSKSTKSVAVTFNYPDWTKRRLKNRSPLSRPVVRLLQDAASDRGEARAVARTRNDSHIVHFRAKPSGQFVRRGSIIAHIASQLQRCSRCGREFGGTYVVLKAVQLVNGASSSLIAWAGAFVAREQAEMQRP